GQAGVAHPGQVGLGEEAAPQGAPAVAGGEVVAEDPRPYEGLAVEVDHLAGGVEVGGRPGDSHWGSWSRFLVGARLPRWDQLHPRPARGEANFGARAVGVAVTTLALGLGQCTGI